MDVSIAMATYNGARFLPQQLASIAGQARLPAELVVGDDGSTDGTPELIEAFGRTVPFPVRVAVNGTRLGHIGNFLATAGRCHGEAIAFCDQDDVWRPDKLDRCVAALERTGALLVMHAADLVDQDLKPLGGRLPDVRRACVHGPLRVNPYDASPGFALVFRRSVLSLAPYADVPEDQMDPGRPMGHDHWVWFLASVFGSVASVPQPLALYRRHASNTTSPVEVGLGAFLRQAAHAGAEVYRNAADISGQRAAFLRRLPADGGGRVAAAVTFYDGLVERFQRRAAIHDRASRRRDRVRAWVRLTAGRQYYGRDAGGLGLRAWLKDSLRLLRA